MTLASQPRDLPSLTGLRFLAAAIVLVRHTVLPIAPFPVLTELAILGPIGVGFFFVLSGFVLTWSSSPESSKRDFYWKRFARLYPLHVLLTIAAVSIAVLAERDPRWPAVIASIFLVQSWMTDYFRSGGNGVSWSLSCEAFFYACFPFLIRTLRRQSTRRCGIIIAATFGTMTAYTAAYALLAQFNFDWSSTFSTYTFPAYRIGQFSIGILLAIALQKGYRLRCSLRAAVLFATASYLGLATINWAVNQMGVKLGGEAGLPLGVLDLAFVPITCLLIISAAQNDIAGKDGFWNSKPLINLGKWSFALYLVQVLIIDEVVEILPETMPVAQALAAWIAVICICILASWALHVGVERPMNRYLRGFHRPTRDKLRPVS